MTAQWDRVAEQRFCQIEGGLDLTFSRVFVPFFTELVERLSPARVLEIGAGTGHLAKSLSGRVVEYTALEPSTGMRAVASRVLAGGTVELRGEPAEEYAAERPFDAVICHLVLQAVATPAAILRAARRALPSGTLIFSIPHPCFYRDYRCFTPDPSFKYMEESSREVDLRISLDPKNAVCGIPFNHRPLAYYFEILGEAGFLLRRFTEVKPDETTMALYGSRRWNDPRYVVFEASA